MIIDETKEILRLICAAYPTQRQKLTSADMHAMLEVWSLALADVEFALARAAAGRIVCSSKWLPSIAEFRAEIGVMHHGERRNGLDAWGDVRTLRTYREREAMATFDPLVIQVCQRYDWIEWRTLFRNGEDVEQWHVVTGENDESDRIRFAQLYDSLARDERKQAQLAPGGKIPQRLPAGEGRTLGAIVAGMLPEKVPA